MLAFSLNNKNTLIIEVQLKDWKRYKFRWKNWNFVKSRNIFTNEQNVSQLEVKHAIFYTYQISGACTGVCVCACDRMHQMEKTVAQTSVMFCSGFIISINPLDSNTFDVWQLSDKLIN